MSIFDNILDAQEWRDNPVRNAGRTALCTVSPFVCVGEHAAGRTAELTETAVEAVQTAASEAAQGASGTLMNLVENLPTTDDIVAVGSSIENILMWVSIIAGILLAVILVGVVLYYVPWSTFRSGSG